MNKQIGLTFAIIAATALGAVLLRHAVAQQNLTDKTLAEALANDKTQAAAIASIRNSGDSKIPLLKSWAERAPDGVPECALYGGMAQAFGEMRTKEAIPFLIKHIGLYRSCGVSFGPWLKGADVIEWNLPATGALVKIGPDASRAVMAAFQEMPYADRLPALFVVSQIRGVPEARAFLESALAEANAERRWAEDGIQAH